MTTLAAQIRELAAQRDALILAHNYQVPEVQNIADEVGDSLALARAAATSHAPLIVFCGVHFMAETAKILSQGKRVLIPDLDAGCSLADSITADDVRQWKTEHPDAVVVSYVNTTAAVKAETDYCCTSSNAADVVRAIPEDREVLFLPDQFLGAHVRRETGRDNLHIWMGECHVHAGIDASHLRQRLAEEPDAELYIHPECGCATSALYLAGEGLVPAGARSHPVYGRHGRRGGAHQGGEGPGGDGDRHAASAARPQPRHRLPPGQPPCPVPVHEDDHSREGPPVAARGHVRDRGRTGPGNPRPPCRGAHDCDRGAVSIGIRRVERRNGACSLSSTRRAGRLTSWSAARPSLRFENAMARAWSRLPCAVGKGAHGGFTRSANGPLRQTGRG